jgi:hypothetical protein
MIIERHAAGADGRDDAQDFRPVGPDQRHIDPAADELLREFFLLQKS